MPYYSCIFRSLPPANDALVRAEAQDKGARSSLFLLSRLIRESTCQWISANLKPIAQGIKNQQEKLGPEKKVTIEAWRLMPHLRVAFSLFIEMAAAADLADESLVDMKVYDYVLEQFWTCLNALGESKEVEKAMHMNRWALDLLQILREKDKPLFAKRICSPVVWFLWGQALIKIARNYLIPNQHSHESVVSQEHHRALYLYCLDIASTKFEKCERLVVQLSRAARGDRHKMQTLKELTKMSAECSVAQGHIALSKSREAISTQVRERTLLEARTLLRRAYFLDAQSLCIYNLACVAALSRQPLECQSYLRLAAKNKVLPPLIHVFNDPDLEFVRSFPWFASFLQEDVPSEKPSTDTTWIYSTDIGMSLLESQFAMPEPTLNFDHTNHASLHIPKQPDFDPALFAMPPPHSKQQPPAAHNKPHPSALASPTLPSALPSHQKPPQNDPYQGLTESMYFDEGLNKLQASLTRDGFSRSTVVQMLTEVHKQKKADKAQNERFEAAHARLMVRLEAAGMKQKSVIPGDGNCQFHSISDQMFDKLEQSAWIRSQIVAWLKSHGDWILPENGAQLKDFCMDDWDSYCANMSKPGIWGDHMTLTAAAHLFGVRIVLFSSIEDNHYVTEYLPSIITSPKVLYLCHYAEYHYGSVCKKEPEDATLEKQADHLAATVVVQNAPNAEAKAILEAELGPQLTSVPEAAPSSQQSS